MSIFLRSLTVTPLALTTSASAIASDHEWHVYAKARFG
jgi:hypothetical protein